MNSYYKDNNAILMGLKGESCDNYDVLVHQKCADISNCYTNENLYGCDECKTGQIMENVEGNSLSMKSEIYDLQYHAVPLWELY